MNGAPLDLLHRVLRGEVRVCDADPARRAEFEVQVRTQYSTSSPCCWRYRQHVLREA